MTEEEKSTEIIKNLTDKIAELISSNESLKKSIESLNGAVNNLKDEIKRKR